jgi:hypothetical protein
MNQTEEEHETEYHDWMADIAKDCKCCPICSDYPCGGVQAGGICDQAECTCDDVDYWEDEYLIDDIICGKRCSHDLRI